MICKLCKWAQGLGIYLLSIAMWLDEGINVMLLPPLRVVRIIPYDEALGSAHFTVSQYFAYAALEGSRFATGVCWLLTKIFSLWIKTPSYNHCFEAIHYSDGTLIPPSENEG